MDFEIKDKLKEALKNIISFDEHNINENDITNLEEEEDEIKDDIPKLNQGKKNKNDSNKRKKIGYDEKYNR